MTPPEQGVSTNIEQIFAVTLQFEDLAVTNLIFLLHAYFYEKSGISIKCILYECCDKKV